MLSGNRNFEGRVHPDVKANYLASPPLVVAYAIAGTVDIDLSKEPLGTGKDGKPVFLKDVWPTRAEIDAATAAVSSGLFARRYANVFDGSPAWNALESPTGETYPWDAASTYIQEPPFFQGLAKDPGAVAPIRGARVLAVLGDSGDHGPHLARRRHPERARPGKWLGERGVPKDFNSYGARRGNDQVMMRGTFANVRVKNLMLARPARASRAASPCSSPPASRCRSTTRPRSTWRRRRR